MVKGVALVGRLDIVWYAHRTPSSSSIHFFFFFLAPSNLFFSVVNRSCLLTPLARFYEDSGALNIGS